MAFSPDGKLAASGSRDHTVKIWNTTPDPEAQTIRVGRVNHTVFSPDGNRLAWQGDSALCVLDVSTSETIQNCPLGGYGGLAFSPNGNLLAVGMGNSKQEGIRILDIATGQTNQILKGNKFVYGVAFSPDGKLVAGGDGDLSGDAHPIKICDVASDQEIYTLKGHAESVWDVAFSPNGRLLASASGGIDTDNEVGAWGGSPGEVKIWDLSSQKEIYTLRGHKFCVWSLRFSPDGKRLATASGAYSGNEPGEVRIWDVDSGKELMTLTGFDQCVFSVVFSPDGKRMVTSDGSYSGKRPVAVKIWDSETGAKLLSLRGNRSAVFAVAFSPDGNRIASGGGDGNLRIWNAYGPSN